MTSASHILLLFIGALLETAQSSDPANISNYLLPDNHVPSEYYLRLEVDPDKDTYDGQTTITFSTKNVTNSILLHASTSHITKMNDILYDLSHNCKVSSVNQTTEIINITCVAPFAVAENNKLFIAYTGVFGKSGSNDSYHGFYKSSYDTYNGTDNYTVTQFQETHARKAFPCFDEPRFKAKFGITIIHPSGTSALANAKIQSQSKLNDYLTNFETTPPISTYLLALVVSKFKRTSTDNTNTSMINIHSRPNQVQYTDTAIQYSRDLVDALSQWTGISYEELGISKLDLVAVPFVSRDMENWGLITFQEADLLDEGIKTSASDKQTIISAMTHEIAHQWFGDYVTLDWWSNAWLNEGFAAYFQSYIPDLIDGLNMEVARQFVPKILQKAFESDDTQAKPLSSPYDDIQTPTDANDKFDDISHSKGASVIRMMRNILSEENFQQGLQLYLRENAYKNSTPQKLLSALGKKFKNTNITFENVMDTWIYKSGYPIVTVSLGSKKNLVTLSQKEFGVKSTADDKNEKIWNIPITFTTSKNINFNIKDLQWLNDKTPLEISIDDDSWIIVNLQQIGYYRVNYDNELWQRIILVLKSDQMRKIHVSNRAQLVDDAFSLAKVGELSYKVAFDVAGYLVQETEYEPWYAAQKSVKYLKRILEVHNDESALKRLKTVVLNWINTAFPNDHKANLTTHLQILTNDMLVELKCSLGEEKCLSYSQDILDKFIETDIVENHNTRVTALCYGLKESRTLDKEYNIIWESYKKSNSALEKRALLSALGCIHDPSTLTKYLSEMLSNTSTYISDTEAKYIYEAVTSNNNGLEVILPFLKDHLRDILDRYTGLITLSNLIVTPAKWIVSGNQLNQLKEIIDKYKDVEGMNATGKRAMEVSMISNQWFANNKKDIDDTLAALAGKSITIVPSIILMLISFFVFIEF